MRRYRLDVFLTPSDELLHLRAQVQELQRALDDLRRDYNRLELQYRGECIINLELQDLLRDNGIPFRGVISSRHLK